MDASVGLIADYAHALRYSDLPATAVHHCKRCVIDTFGVALGAFDAQPSRIARDLALRACVTSGARMIGAAHLTLPELAAFANGVMVRYLDGNDCFPGGGGHPSDTIPAILAAADASGADGRTVITSVILSYEIYYNLWKSTSLFDKGIDNVFYAVVASAAGAAKVLGLDRDRIVEAISLAITPNIPLDATRYGALSIWKGCASGNAARNGVFAALLAAAGMTGPEKPIMGAHGLQNMVGAFDLLPFGGGEHPFRISEITLKSFASVSHALSPVTAVLQLCRQVKAEDIATVTLYTYWFAWEINGREPEKWRPATREAADHSLPYILAAVLVDGYFSDEMFSDERLRDPRIRQLIDKIVVKVDPEFTPQFPLRMPCRIEITTKNGEHKTAQVDYPRGHDKNPMTDEEVNAKFRGHARRVLKQDRVEQALAAMWSLDSASDASAIFEAVTIGG